MGEVVQFEREVCAECGQFKNDPALSAYCVKQTEEPGEVFHTWVLAQKESRSEH